MSKNELQSSGERRRRVLRIARVNCTTVPFCRTLRADASYFYGIFQKEMVY